MLEPCHAQAMDDSDTDVAPTGSTPHNAARANDVLT